MFALFLGLALSMPLIAVGYGADGDGFPPAAVVAVVDDDQAVVPEREEREDGRCLPVVGQVVITNGAGRTPVATTRRRASSKMSPRAPPQDTERRPDAYATAGTWTR